jgi:pyrroloquinoline quinone biosynthesis protein D
MIESIGLDAKPKLRRGVRLTHNEAQGGWVLLAPEKIFKTDPIGAEILKRCDGEKNLGVIVEELASAYNAPVDRVRTDVVALLQTLKEKQLLDL